MESSRSLLVPRSLAVLLVAGARQHARPATRSSRRAPTNWMRGSRPSSAPTKRSCRCSSRSRRRAPSCARCAARSRKPGTSSKLLRQQQRDLYGDLDRRLLLLENGAAPATPAAERHRAVRGSSCAPPTRPASTATRSRRSRPGATRMRSAASSSTSPSTPTARAPTARLLARRGALRCRRTTPRR